MLTQRPPSKQRQAIRRSSERCGQMARRLQVSKVTIHRWKHRERPQERSCRPHRCRQTLSTEKERLVLVLGSYGLTLDETWDVISSVLPNVGRSNVYRTFQRHGVNRLKDPKERKAGTFKEYPPGFLHLNCFYLPTLEGTRRYCFVAVDRTTRLAFLEVYQHKDAKSATDFLSQCHDFFVFEIETLLTDNGGGFTSEGFRNRYDPAKRAHPFDQLCEEKGIEHRRTKPYTPQTNGLVERMNGLTKENTTKRYRYATSKEMIHGLK